MATMQSLETGLMIAMGLLLAAAIGFAGGVYFERTATQRLLRSSRRKFTKWFRTVVRQLEGIERACSAVDASTSLQLTASQATQIALIRDKLVRSLGKVVEAQQSTADTRDTAQTPQRRSPRKCPSVKWVTGTDSAIEDGPDPEGVRANLALLVETTHDAQTGGGLLLIKADNSKQLKQRYGTQAISGFVTEIQRLTLRALRDSDLVRRYTEDSIAVLFPNVDMPEGRRLSESIRDGIRNHHFRVNGTGTEVLVTASLGYAQCQPNDDPSLVLSRSHDALDRSRRHGRNQLHVSDGTECVHCAALDFVPRENCVSH